MTFITYEEVFNETITYQGLINLIHSQPIDYWIRLASMGHMLLEHHPPRLSDMSAQTILFEYFVPESIRTLMVTTYGNNMRALFHGPQFLALMRLALLHGKQVNAKLDTEKGKDITTRCLLGINSLIYSRRDQDQHFDTQELISKLTFYFRNNLNDQEKKFLMSLVQVYFNSQGEHIGNLLGRYKDMAIDIPNEANFSPDGVNRDLLKTHIELHLGISVADYSALTFGVIAKYLNGENLFKKETNFGLNPDTYFTTTALPQDLVNRYFSAIVQSHSEFTKEQQEKGQSEESICDFQSFMLKPLIHIDNRKECYPASLSFLQRLLEAGFTWVLTDGEFDSDLRNYWGQTFEYYCSKVCQRIAANSKIKPKYFGELQYNADGKQKQSCDAIFVYGDKAVMIEFKIKCVSQQSIINANFDVFCDDIDKLLIESDGKLKAAAQIDQTIKALRNSQLILPGVNAIDIKYFFPLVITLQSWPNGRFVYELIRRQVRARNLLSHGHIASLELWSAQDFEYIETLLSSELIDLATLIKDKHLSNYANLPLYLFLFDKYTDKYAPNKYLMMKTDEMFEIVKNKLSLNTTSNLHQIY